MLTLRYSRRTISATIPGMSSTNPPTPRSDTPARSETPTKGNLPCGHEAYRQNETEEYSATARPPTVRRRLSCDALRWENGHVRSREEGNPPLGAGRHCSRRAWLMGDARLRSNAGEGHVSVSGAAGAARVWSDPAC